MNDFLEMIVIWKGNFSRETICLMKCTKQKIKKIGFKFIEPQYENIGIF